TLGIDLRDISLTSADSILDNVFIRNPQLKAGITFNVPDIDGSAHLGFVKVLVQNGSADANFSITVSLNDPGTHLTDGRIDISELIAAPGSLFQKPVFAGSAHFKLPLAVPFLGINTAILPDLGNPQAPHTTLTLNFDLSSPTAPKIDFPGGLL